MMSFVIIFLKDLADVPFEDLEVLEQKLGAARF